MLLTHTAAMVPVFSSTNHEMRCKKQLRGFSRASKWLRWRRNTTTFSWNIRAACILISFRRGRWFPRLPTMPVSGWSWHESSLPWNVESTYGYMGKGKTRTFARSQLWFGRRACRLKSSDIVRYSILRNTGVFVPMALNPTESTEEINRTIDRCLKKLRGTFIKVPLLQIFRIILTQTSAVSHKQWLIQET